MRSFTLTGEYALWFPWRTAVRILWDVWCPSELWVHGWCERLTILEFSATLTSGQQKMMCDDDRATSLAPQVAFDTCWLQTENTWSRLEVKLSDVLPAINQINCTYIDLMGLEWGHGVGDINLGWKSAIGLVRSHLTGSPWPAGRGGWFLWWFIFMYLSILLQPQLPWIWDTSQPS